MLRMKDGVRRLRTRVVKQSLFLASKQPYHLVRAVAHRWRLNEYFSLQISWSYDMVSGISPLTPQRGVTDSVRHD